MPLMVSTGMFSLVLFVDRTMLLWHDPSEMGAALAAGNLFWLVICPFVGIASITGAIVSQLVGAGQNRQVGTLLWQVIWLAAMTVPLFGAVSLTGDTWIRWAGQPESIRAIEVAYFSTLLWGGAGEVLQTGLSGFYAGIHRTRTIMVISLISGLLNMMLDAVLIFGVDLSLVGLGSPGERVFHWGIEGAAIASVASFHFKAIVFALLLCQRAWRDSYGIFDQWKLNGAMMRRLVFFGLPAGLMYEAEAGGFTAIVLRIGRLGEGPLQATTMAINFNMIAFIPLVGLSIATSVLVGQYLIRDGWRPALQRVQAAMLIGWTYSIAWALAYGLAADAMIGFYGLSAPRTSLVDQTAVSNLAASLLGFVAIYVVFDAHQLILAGALRGAGDTWYVLAAFTVVSLAAVLLGIYFEPTLDRLEDVTASSTQSALAYWWWVITGWVFALAVAMTARFMSGRWRSMRMVE
ncbi:MAG: MATE family efflux transporter [Planctomycetota bacterium]